MKKNSRK